MNSVTVRALLVRGMLAGICAGALAFVFAYLVGEGPVDAAIAFEEANSHHAGGEELVSRSVQSTAGLATGVLVFGVAIGGIAALAFCFALGRVGRFGARATAALTALAGFLTVYLVPFLKYPANPPAVGNPDTLDKRTALFFLMIALSVLLGIAAVLLGRRLAPVWGNWNASVAAGLAFAAVTAVAMAVLPSGENTPKGFPATDLWEFRLASIGVQAVLWTAFGLLFGFLAERVLEARAGARPAAAASGVTASAG
ncbi:membrane protein [Streptomyces scabiei]|uniref:CbtA family protein n=1 Tax=Streptomyces scabiei TaxID=1930 RepID=UPI0004E79541|nr:CbtA family protein [Streptomyces scabiei]KFF98248.1 membrane protein [Streptomyces scabiei]